MRSSKVLTAKPEVISASHASPEHTPYVYLADGDEAMNVVPVSIPNHMPNVQSLVEATTIARENRTERVHRLQEEARSLAREQIAELEVLIDATARMAFEISDGGDAYSVGAREVCRRLADELPRTLQTLQMVSRKSV
ncbi:MAG: hypothetical protein AAGC58_09085 [Asticcacaulis sp.]